MNKMLVAVFNSETLAFEGLSVLRTSTRTGTSLDATVVLSKDASGEVSLKQTADEGPIGTALGTLAGSLVGLLAGPVGLAVGASRKRPRGLIPDLGKTGIDLQFVDEVSQALSPGKAAVLADLEESWTAPVEARIGSWVAWSSTPRPEVVEDQLAREAAVFQAEVTQLTEEARAGTRGEQGRDPAADRRRSRSSR